MSRNDFYPHFCTPPGRNDAQVVLRRGLTLVEILVAVTLMTFIMLAAIQVLTYVSAEMNRAQSAMVIAGRARAAQLQIERDLACITAPLTPPLRFDDAQGYFCIIEGLGSDYLHPQLFHKDRDGNDKIGWGLEDIAVNSETGEYDSTIGDCDDILMFTARALGDSMFRGLVGGEIMESKEAEICYFLRGTTLYRRVLLIIPDEKLQNVLSDPNSDYSGGARPARDGYGFYRDFDVSARLERDGSALVVKANTLADLTRRENRFGHANQPLSEPNPFPYGIHNLPMWYHLRLPTLAECTMDKAISALDVDGASWRVGRQIVSRSMQKHLVYDDDRVNDALWVGEGVINFPKAIDSPYIDYWYNPLPWNNEGTLSADNQSLTSDSKFYDLASTSTFKFGQRVNDDVLLNNVIGFDVKVWHAEQKEFIDLGGYKNDNPDFQLSNPDVNEAHKISRDLGSQGFYGRIHGNRTQITDPYCYSDGTYRYRPLPCVYDTWTDAHENDGTGEVFDWSGVPKSITGISQDPAYDGITDIMEHVDKWRCPPPYNVPLTGIQIKIRVFDPDTNNIREVTIRKNFN